MAVRKDDLIAELKRSKDMDGVRKLKEERAKSAVQILREESKETSKEFTAEAFLSEVRCCWRVQGKGRGKRLLRAEGHRQAL